MAAVETAISRKGVLPSTVVEKPFLRTAPENLRSVLAGGTGIRGAFAKGRKTRIDAETS
jgi:hypothetical protein